MESVTGQHGENVREHVGNNSSKAEPEHVLIHPWMELLLLPKSHKNVMYLAVNMTHIYDESCIKMHSEWSSEISVWHGDEDVAVYTTEGGTKPAGESTRDPTMMFDNDLTSYWHTAVNGGKVEVNFHKEIAFEKLEILKRPGAYWQRR